MSSHPKFAVVGHPNKGKSSIVSTLSQDEQITISSIPGTTTKSRAFPLVVEGETLYELYDTPGFQRARAILAWLQNEPTPANKRAERLAKFVKENLSNKRFSDDIELLKPIIDGAGIIYVVDGSKPYGAEYEAEMEILRWSGAPSMALINLIGEDDYQKEWQSALEHYFKIVRVFNPMRATFSQIIELLEAMAELKYDWRESLKKSTKALRVYQLQKIKKSAIIITDTIYKALSHQEEGSRDKEILIKKFQAKIRDFEDRAYDKIATTWHHKSLKKEITLNSIINVELFSKESSLIFGLDKKELIKNAAIAGALTGGGFDLLVGGHSFFLGSAVGAIIGGGGVLIGSKKIESHPILDKFSKKRVVTVGPIKDINFGFILLKRLLYFTKEVANRPHANRKELKVDEDELLSKEWIDESLKKELFKIHLEFAKSKTALKSKYQELIEEILLSYIEH